MRDLRANGVDVVTIGRPSSLRAFGFGSVFSGPLVRSSYRADEQRRAAVVPG
jgi:lipoate synthase